MKVVGLTGGIGSGKTTILEMFKNLGVPVYIADLEAKSLMEKSKIIKRKLVQNFGTKVYNANVLNREYLASKVFSSKDALNIVNNIVHPRVGAHFSKWLKKQDSHYVIKEAAIIFENGKEKEYDFIITVIADREQRIDRILKRDAISKERILAIMENQLSDRIKVEKSDFVIKNNDLKKAQESVLKIHKTLLKQCIK